MMRNPGLLHGPTRVECEDVKTAHKKPCEVCGAVPRRRRLKVSVGGGRGGHSYVLCEGHGVSFIERRQSEYHNLSDRLTGIDIAVRLETECGDPTWGGYAAKRKAEKERRESKGKVKTDKKGK